MEIVLKERGWEIAVLLAIWGRAIALVLVGAGGAISARQVSGWSTPPETAAESYANAVRMEERSPLLRL